MLENIYEEILQNKWDDLLHARNSIGFRRDLASPMSEMMGVAIFAGILWFMDDWY